MDGLTVAIAAIAGLALGFLAALWRGGRARAALEASLGEARAAAEIAESRRLDLQAALDRAHEGEASARAAAHRAETDAALARQQAESIRQQMADWEKTRTEFLETTKAGVFQTAQQISSKLLEDHKRETAEAKLAAEKQLAQTTAALRQEVQALGDGVSQLKGQVTEKAQMIDTIQRALSSPGGAGYFAEIGLANTLKSFGLEQGRDFVLQQTVYGAEAERKLRPDAIVFLPGDAVLVIDSKASKHLLDLAEAEGTAGEAVAYQSLARTMNQHLKDLADKDYRGAVQSGFRKSGREGEVSRVLSVMYLPNEAAIEKLGRADPDFARKAADVQIIPAGPSGLACIIGFAAVEISLMRQIENQARIVGAAEKLLESLSVAVGHAASVGRGIKQAADGFAKLTGTLNGRLLPRARQMQQLGLRPGKPVPGNLGAYQVVDAGADSLIEGEALDLAEDAALIAPNGSSKP
ncbi:DNA recombination protein RmuC [Aliidongia dinghuensis]|uniref:DNA recombination protein RmuC homolog n=1 Tax=Aliidongia dinghuensis TaxID=1867774 RepID=A0A8J3E2H8_9PROT|nr:DNA recombination protein RmuC [Aliidongia dinghuensis]GGF08732.1 DNA recombination protein RmuC [Aliidongia dinghuensis]